MDAASPILGEIQPLFSKSSCFLIIAPMEGRIIGRFDGHLPGPLFICLGGMHGNEPAGILAIEEVLRLLRLETQQHPEFTYRGTFLGLRGNLAALRDRKRFIERDLNRMLLEEEVIHLQSLSKNQLVNEDKECLELISLIQSERTTHSGDRLLLLDLHTTTAGGGIFSIAADDEMSLLLAKGLHVPVILGIAQGLKGTTIDYFNRPLENTHCLVFEAGQHDDPGSVFRTVSAIINCMRSIGAVLPEDVDHRHDGLLMGESEGLPRVTRLVYHYKIHPGETFHMKPGFRNFDFIQKGEVIASNANGAIHSPCDGLILMPKYQSQGEDGFFIVEKIE